MNSEAKWKERCQRELEQARMARQVGNEGMARVCSRRAAGVVIAEFLERDRGELPSTTSAFSLLKRLRDDSEIPQQVRAVVGHFITPINFDHELPSKADLIAEVYWLADTLLGEKI
jgi:HEPN domain-containing protein